MHTSCCLLVASAWSILSVACESSSFISFSYFLRSLWFCMFVSTSLSCLRIRSSRVSLTNFTVAVSSVRALAMAVSVGSTVSLMSASGFLGHYLENLNCS